MKKSTSKDERISVRLTPNQMQVLTELRDSLGTTYSIILRAIVLDFLQRNENELEALIRAKNEANDDNLRDSGE